jgi:hypothetical protein
MTFAILSTPFWLVAFLLAGVPLVLILIMGALSVAGLGTGFLMLRDSRNTVERRNS